jgi:hypothetical protein
MHLPVRAAPRSVATRDGAHRRRHPRGPTAAALASGLTHESASARPDTSSATFTMHTKPAVSSSSNVAPSSSSNVALYTSSVARGGTAARERQITLTGRRASFAAITSNADGFAFGGDPASGRARPSIPLCSLVEYTRSDRSVVGAFECVSPLELAIHLARA